MSLVLNKISEYNVAFCYPGKSDRSSMPIGNGELGLNVWVEEDGDLQFYIARTDAITELDRTVKLGKVKISLNPNPFVKGKPFLQELNLADGYIRIFAGKHSEQIEITLFVSKSDNSIYVNGISEKEIDVKVKYINWRTEYSKKEPKNGYISESQDKVLTSEECIVFYHKNEENIIKFTADLQSVGEHLDKIPDFLTGRIFGGIISMEKQKSPVVNGELKKNNTFDFDIKITTHSEQIFDENKFIKKIKETHIKLPSFEIAFKNTKSWWNEYWQKSYIFVEGDKPVRATIKEEVLNSVGEKSYELCKNLSTVTQAYILTKWMTACCSNGNFPIYYNGMLFNLIPGNNEHFSVVNFGRCFTSLPSTEPNMEFNPDERSWCTEHLWQNLRLPYFSMPARGENETLKNLFRYFRNFWDLNRVRADVFYGAKGQHNTEMTLTFGLQTPEIYGLDRTNMPVGYSDNRAGGAVDISPGLELIQMMFEYFNYSNDTKFLKSEILPYAKELLLYVETRFTKREIGKLVIGPLQSVETYRNTKNPVTVIAGLISCLDNILKLPKELVEDYSYFKSFESIVPEIPMEMYEDERVISPAQEYNPLRENCEPPEIYTVFPFKLYTHYKPQLDLALKSYKKAVKIAGSFRPFIIGETPGAPSYSGWQYIGLVAALLGLRDDAKTVLENNCSLRNPGYSFPSMWGPIYDAVPDTDHGANILNTLQLMTFQIDDDKIFLLPAFPKEWNVSFKMHAPKNTIVECVYKNGIIEKLDVIPKEREKDILICMGEYL